jgi:hypothetical protein
MRTAFYFDEDTAYDDPFRNPPDVAVIAAIANMIPVHRRHVYILCGTMASKVLAPSREHAQAMTQYLLGIRQPVWSSFTSSDLYSAIATKTIAAFVAQGLLAKDSRLIDEQLRETRGYLGAVQVQPGEFSWLLYDSSLPPRYRVIGSELRLMYAAYAVEIEDDRDPHEVERWKERGLFEAVEWEDTGAQGTYFDPFDNPEHAKMVGESEELVIDQLSRIVDEITLSVAKLDPRLVRQLHGALKAFDGLDTGDSLAHVALSCRRLLERIADALYPPQSEKVDGRKVGQAEYRNRLWAYIKQSIESKTQRDIMISTLVDVGNRVDAIDSAANKGLHADLSAGEVQRLLIAMLTLIYDLFTLAPLPLASPSKPYEVSSAEFLKILKGQ